MLKGMVGYNPWHPLVTTLQSILSLGILSPRRGCRPVVLDLPVGKGHDHRNASGRRAVSRVPAAPSTDRPPKPARERPPPGRTYRD